MKGVNCQTCAYHCPGGELWAEGGAVMSEAELLEFERDRALFRVEYLELLVNRLWATFREIELPTIPMSLGRAVEEVVLDPMVVRAAMPLD